MNPFSATRHPPRPCLGCGKKMDAATGVNHDYAPKPGSITICMYCGHLMAFDDDLCYRPLNDEEMLWVAGNKVIVEAQKARASVMRVRDAVKKGKRP